MSPDLALQQQKYQYLNISIFLANKHYLVIELSLSQFLAVGDRIVAIAFLR